MSIQAGQTALAEDFINQSEKDATPANDEGRVPKLENDGNVSKAFLQKKTLSISSSATPAVNVDIYEIIKVVLDRNITSMSSGLSGTPKRGNKLKYYLEYTDSSFSFVASAEATTFSSTVMRVDKPTGTAEGDIMIATMRNGNTSSSYDLSSAPAGWTQLLAQTGSSVYRYVYYKVAGASEPSTYDWTFGGTNFGVDVNVATYRGNFDVNNPIMTTTNSNYTTSNSTIRCGSATPSAYNTIAIACGYLYGGSSTTPASGWTEDFDSDGFFFAHKDVTSASPTSDADFTSSGSNTRKFGLTILLNVARYITWGSSFSDVGDFLPSILYPQHPLTVELEYNETTSKFETTGEDKTSRCVIGADNPLILPVKVGQFYYNIASARLYFAKGTSSLSDWIALN